MKQKETTKNPHNKQFFHKLLLYVLVMLFFTSMIFVYYYRLLEETRSNITNKCRINAIEVSHRIEDSMNSSMDALILAAYSMDNMLREGRSREDILDYLVNDTVAIGDSLIKGTTGIYGYINGEYMDGSGWVPEEGYDPTSRPWYLESKAGNGKLVIVDPYLDMDTGSMMIALGRTLCDAKSVIAIDLAMDDVQEIIEEHTMQGTSAETFIVSGKGTIIADSDTSRIGTEIYRLGDPVSEAVAKALDEQEESDFSLDREGKNFRVFVTHLDFGWTIVSVIDATEEYARLRVPLLVTVIAVIATVVIFLVILRISENKSRSIREASMQIERAQAANEAKTAFLSNMSHEIRTPINAILGMNEMILRESEERATIGYAERIKSAGNALLAIINDVLDFSKIEAGKIEIISNRYDLSALLSDLVNLTAGRAGDKGLTLRTDFDESLPKWLVGDATHIKQIITNVLSNAVKYTEEGSIIFRVSYERIPEDPDRILLYVSVQDTGIGIREEDLPKLFNKFERIEERRNRNIEGTGLGMNITQGLLEMMDSSLNVESIYGEGSVFWFALRQTVDNWEPIGKYEIFRDAHDRQLSASRCRFTAKGARVLVVDDNPMNLEVFRNLIRRTLVETDEAPGGEEGLELTRGRKYDLIFLDHMMPGKDGIEVLRELREEAGNPNRHTPAVCLTANAVSGAKDQYLQAGFDDYLTKPIDPVALEESLLKYLPQGYIEKVCAAEEEENLLADVPEEILQLDGDIISVESGIQHCGSVEAYRSLLKMFRGTLVERAAELNGLYEAGNLPEYTIKVHALKSSARIIGAASFGEKAQQLEDAGKQEDMAYIREHHDAFMEEFLSFGPMLAGIFGTEEEDADRPEADEGTLSRIYAELAEAADEMDCDKIESLMEELAGYRIPGAGHELYKKLKDAAARFEYDTISELLTLEEGNH